MTGFRVLYVDDEPDLLELGKIFLEQNGQFSVDTVTSATAALDLLGQHPYDAIIADYQMPVMDGIGFLKRVRSSGNTIPFILFTGRGREEVVIQALNEGADFFLQKGGDPTPQFAELAHKIQKAVLQKRAENAVILRESYLTAIIENQPGLVWLKDLDGRFLAANEAFARSCGRQSAGDLLGLTDLDVWPEELAKQYPGGRCPGYHRGTTPACRGEDCRQQPGEMVRDLQDAHHGCCRNGDRDDRVCPRHHPAEIRG